MNGKNFQELTDIINAWSRRENIGLFNQAGELIREFEYSDSDGDIKGILSAWIEGWILRIMPIKRIVDLTKEDLDMRLINNETLFITENDETINWAYYNKSGIKFQGMAIFTPYYDLMKFKWADGTNCYKEIEG